MKVWGEKGVSLEGAEAVASVSSSGGAGFGVGIVGPGAGPCGGSF